MTYATSLEAATPATNVVARDQSAYRPDIDGLRAVAVIAVVLYHAFPAAVPGGFVGVDVFFVISGFLISGIVFSQMVQGRFSFRDFYVRRICRIFPALVVVLSLTCVVGWMWLLPGDWLSLGQEIRGGAFFFANLVFLNQAGYFDLAATQKPLLHLWSLAIEEQFYLVWPIVVLLIYRRPAVLSLVILAGLAVSLTSNILQVANDPTATFYLPGTRAWELLIGCLLAYRAQFSESTVAWNFSGIDGLFSYELQALLGVLLIAAGVVLFDSRQLFPGWRALFPTLGAALLISAGSANKINRRLLANPPITFVGLISYPLYLWHWPIFSFAIIYKGSSLGIEERLILIGVAVACSIATYLLIERPIRFGPLRRPKAAVVLALLCATVGGLGHIIAGDNIRPNASRFGVDRLVAVTGEWAYPTADLVGEHYHGHLFYKFSGAGGPNSILFFGDSNMEMYWPRVQLLAQQKAVTHGDTIYFLTLGGCPPLPNTTEVHHPYCAGLVDAAEAFVRERNIKTVVIAAHWWGYLYSNSMYQYKGLNLSRVEVANEAVEALAQMVRPMIADGRKVWVIMNIPWSGMMDPRNMFKRHLTSFDISSPPVILSNFEQYVAITNRMRSLLDEVGAKTLDPLEYLCSSEGVCPTVTPAGAPVYRDTMHLRPNYVRTHVSYLDRVLE
jgi:peptidoglycan/LPS O-acetylase OafA/YrhL